MTWFEWLGLACAMAVAAATVGAAIAAYKGQREQLASVTGGDSLVYLEPLRKAGKLKYFVRQKGDHPAFDVVVRVQEVHRRADGKKKRLLLFGPAEVGRTLKRGSGFDWTYPDPTPHDRREWPLVFSEPPPRDASARTFRIELASRNGIVVQVLRVWPVGDLWHTESKKIKRSGTASPVLPTFHEAQEQAPNPPDSDPEDDLG
jgi:hypothetical protein